jgi:hypothetical protein
LGKLEIWNEQEIVNRGKSLAEKAVLVWDYPEISEDVISQYKKKPNSNGNEKYTIKDFPHLTGEMLDLFEQLRKRICNLDSSVREEFKQLLHSL